ncbi:MAG: hypothetical protein K0Q79_1958 [Flavipsychrobacter sp.]|jgi:hypothetical protein|nr:hypothetical protein [Flavipsychrobacter sp.]
MVLTANWLQNNPPASRLIVILGLVACLVYANTFNNGYVLDDYSAIVNNKTVTKGISAIPEIFSTPYLHGYGSFTNDLYRPLPLAMFATEYHLFGGSPAAGHIINVLFFAAGVMLLFIFLNTLFERKRIAFAFLASLLFALHPIHTEVVANIKSRDELLCFFFSMLTLITLIRYTISGRSLFLATGAVFYFLSLLSKETSITLLFVVPIVFFFFADSNKRRSIWISVIVLATAAAYLIIRSSILVAYNANHIFQFSITTNSIAGATSFAERIATPLLILGKYLKLLFIPYPLISDYSYNTVPLATFHNPWVGLTMGIFVFFAIVGILRLVVIRKDPAAFGIMFFLITLALFSNVFFLVGATMAERFLFFPSVGFCIVVAAIAEKFLSHKITAVALLFVAVTYAAVTIARNTHWKDAYTLYKKDIEHAPNAHRLFYYLGSTIINDAIDETDLATKAKKMEDGIGYLKRSLAIYPGFTELYPQIGNSYLKINALDSAERYTLKAIELNPRDTFSITNLAASYFKQGKYRQSLDLCKNITLLDTTFARAYRNMGSCYLKLGIYDSAIIVLKKAIVLQPGTPAVYGYLGFAYRQTGTIDSANKYEALSR